MQRSFTKIRFLLCIMLLIVVVFSLCAEPSKLHIGHQWPDDQDDFRHEMVKIFADELKKANIKVSIHANAKLFKPREQWSALTSGSLDISVFPLAYAGTYKPEFNLTLMPGLIQSHAHALRFNKSKVMIEIRKSIDQSGVVVLADLWLSGGFVSKNKCIKRPNDVKGLWVRGAGIGYNKVLSSAGAKISSVPSSKIFEELKAGRLDGAITSSTSLVSFKGIRKQTRCLTAPGKYTIWFMYEPLLMSKKSFNKLNDKQKKIVIAAGKKAQVYANAKAKLADVTLVNTYRASKIKIEKMSKDDYEEWRTYAEKSIYKIFEKEVTDGKRLLDLAKSVK